MDDLIYQRMKLHWQELYRSKTDGRLKKSQMLDRGGGNAETADEKREENH